MTADPIDFARSRAILIGTSVYHDTEFLPLPAAANSLQGMAEILTDGQLCRWPADRVTVLPDPVDSRRVIIGLRQRARETRDVLLVYFVGHGTITPGGELCLAMTDTELGNPDVTGVEYRHVRAALLDSPARVKVVILDCCYSGRAIETLSSAGAITDIRGVYTIAASDHGAHVLPLGRQKNACTSFTGELLDLIRTGITGGPETLSLSLIYSHLRTRLLSKRLPDPNQRGTDTAGDFVFTRNAALLPQALARFPRPRTVLPWRGRVAVAAMAAVLAGAATLTAATLLRPASPAAASCGPASPAPGPAQGKKVVVGAQGFAESEILGNMYVLALRAKGFSTSLEYPLSRDDYFQLVCHGAITAVPDYNRALLTFTGVDPGNRAATTKKVDAALSKLLPPSLEILAPSRAQDQDTVTVTRQTARDDHLSNISDLKPFANSMTFGALGPFQSRQQGIVGLGAVYKLSFKSFTVEKNSGAIVRALIHGQINLGDVFSTNPAIERRGLVVLGDPAHLFGVDNVTPLVYKPAAKANPILVATLNAISAKLTSAILIGLNAEVTEKHLKPGAVAAAWLRQVGLLRPPAGSRPPATPSPVRATTRAGGARKPGGPPIRGGSVTLRAYP